jgi:hypothetical protein
MCIYRHEYVTGRVAANAAPSEAFGLTPEQRRPAQRVSTPGGARDGGDAAGPGETGGQTDQESRSTDP